MSEFEKDQEQWTQLQQAAFALHELFVTLLEAGFTERQGLVIVSFLIESMGGPTDDEPWSSDS